MLTARQLLTNIASADSCIGACTRSEETKMSKGLCMTTLRADPSREDGCGLNWLLRFRSMLGKQWLGRKLAQRVGKGLKKSRGRELG